MDVLDWRYEPLDYPDREVPRPLSEWNPPTLNDDYEVGMDVAIPNTGEPIYIESPDDLQYIIMPVPQRADDWHTDGDYAWVVE